MKVHVTEASWINGETVCTVEQLVESSGLTLDEVKDLIDCGVIAPLDRDAQSVLFKHESLVILKAARRLRDDFELDRRGLALALTLLRRVEQLERELNAAQARQARPLPRKP